MVSKEEYVKAVSDLIRVTVVPIFIIFVFSLFKGYIPGVDTWIFEGRSTVLILINAVIALATFSFLAVSFKSILMIISFYVSKFKDDPNLAKAVKSGLILIYVFLAYIFLAKQGNPDSVFGAPLTFLNQISNSNPAEIYDIISKIVLVVTLGIVIYVGFHLWKALTPIIDQQVQATISKGEKQNLVNTSKKCPFCSHEIPSNVKFCPNCGQSLVKTE